MGNYSVPESIRRMKPVGTMVKKIRNHYYVYEYSCRKDAQGKWKSVMGRNIGSITEELGFIPNNNFNADDEITTLDFGQYAIALENSKSVMDALLAVFNPKDACVIYLMGLIHFVNGFVPLKDIRDYYAQSWLSVKYPDACMGVQSLSKLLDSLGRRQARVEQFEQNLLEASSGKLAIDGHVIRSTSNCNDLADFGNKYRLLKERQLNILMAYDIQTGRPVVSRIYDGGELDKVSVKDILGRFDFHDTLFIVDRGFYSGANIHAFSENGNHYIIPLAQNLKSYKAATERLSFEDRFVYEHGRKKSVIEYMQSKLPDGSGSVMVFRDVNENAVESDNYLTHLAKGLKGFSMEEYEKLRPFFGMIVLQSNLQAGPKEVYSQYKNRWQIETFYNYFKNDIDYNALGLTDYYMTQGLSFIMLIAGLIHQTMQTATKDMPETINECLLKGRFIKAHKKHNKWQVTNVKKQYMELFAKLGIDLRIPIA